MKKSLTAVATLMATAAFAQSGNSVTLYGIADAYIGQSSNYQYETASTPNGQFVADKVSQSVVNSSGLNPSRLGFRATEDLGNGVSAFANYEFGVNMDTGSQAATRRTVVGLTTGVGTFSLGSQLASYDDAFSSVNIQGESAFGAANGLAIDINTLANQFAYYAAPSAATLAAAATSFNNGGYAGRTGAWVGYTGVFNNSLRYDSPTINGFSGSVTVGLGENKTATSKATVNTSFNLAYANGPLSLNLANQVEKSPVPAGATALAANLPSDGIYKLRNTLFGGSYDFGVVRVNAGLNQAKANTTGARNQNGYLLGAAVPVGAATFIAQYAQTRIYDANTNSGNTVKSLGLEAQYALSKRSTAYVGFNNTKLIYYTNRLFGVGLRHVF